MATLRRKLAAITERAPLDEHPSRIAALRAKFRHSIAVIDSDQAIESYTCGVHAFHLLGDPTYFEIANVGLGRTFAGARFITFLLENRLLTPRQSSILPGDLILYFEDGVFRHVGRMTTATRVLSKWGTGWLYEHGVWEVPQTYGEDSQYFAGPDADVSFDLFIRYAESEGFQFGESAG